jgi:hypothetical protein
MEIGKQRGMGKMDIEKYIVAATGLGYLVVGLAQYFKGSPSNAFIWLGYAAAQIGLWMNLK